MNPSVRSYLAEFVGTFTLVFVGTAVATLQGFLNQGPTGWLGISFAFGCTLMVLVWVIGPVSGCHVNPAVTIPMAVSGRLQWSLVPGYVIAQLLGALAASGLLLLLLNGLPEYSLAEHGLGANGNPQQMTVLTLFLWEFVMTALFLFTIFSVTRADAPAGFRAPRVATFASSAGLHALVSPVLNLLAAPSRRNYRSGLSARGGSHESRPNDPYF